MEYWGLKEHGYIAFGDSMNDKEMLEHANIGIAMENGDEALFSYADHVCGPSHKDSIYQMLKKCMFYDFTVRIWYNTNT